MFQTFLFKVCEGFTYNSSPCFAFLSETRYTLPKLPLPSFLWIVYLLAIIASEQAELNLATATCLAVSWNFSISLCNRNYTKFLWNVALKSFYSSMDVHRKHLKQKKNLLVNILFLLKPSFNSMAVLVALSLQQNTN